jgi:hypothetical protein
MKIGLYSITYRGVWYSGEALDLFSLLRLAKQQGWEGVELDAERPHAAPWIYPRTTASACAILQENSGSSSVPYLPTAISPVLSRFSAKP